MTAAEADRMTAILYETAKEGTEEILRAGQEPLPLAFTFLNGDLIIIPTGGNREESRGILAEIARTYPLFVTVNSMWIAGPAEVAIYGHPSACPGRKTGVAVQAFQNGKLMSAAALRVEGEAGKPFSFGQWQETGSGFDWNKTKDSIFPG